MVRDIGCRSEVVYRERVAVIRECRVVLQRVEADLMPVRVVEFREDPSDRGELHPGVPRTVFVRFRSKAKLLDRCIGTSVSGGATDTPFHLASEAAMTAATLQERIDALADLSSGIRRRSGRLLAVGQQAAAIEPEIAGMERRAMGDSLTHLRTFAERLAADGMLPERRSVETLADLLWAIAGPRMIMSFTVDRGWSSDQFRDWLAATLGSVLRP